MDTSALESFLGNPMRKGVEEAAVVEQYVAPETSLITCSAGMNIQHFITGFELCRITIKNIPSDANIEEVGQIFTQQGVDTSSTFVLEIKPSDSKMEAVVLTKAEQGEAIAQKLEGIKLREETLSFEVSANATWGGVGVAPQCPLPADFMVDPFRGQYGNVRFGGPS